MCVSVLFISVQNCFFLYGVHYISHLFMIGSLVLTCIYLLRSSFEVPTASGSQRDGTVAKVSLSESLPEEEEEEEVRSACSRTTLSFFNNNWLTPTLII